jgi:hypothetical protein
VISSDPLLGSEQLKKIWPKRRIFCIAPDSSADPNEQDRGSDFHEGKGSTNCNRVIQDSSISSALPESRG